MSRSGARLTFRVAGLENPPSSWQARMRGELVRSGLVEETDSAPDFVLDLGGEANDDRAEESSLSPRLGRWRFRVDGLGVHEVRPACRGSILQGRTSLRAELLSFADGRETIVLREGRVPLTVYSLARSVDAVMDELSRWPIYVCRAWSRSGRLEGPRIHMGGGATEADESRESAPGKTARGWALLREIAWRARVVANFTGRVGRTLFRHDHWNVGVVRRPIQAFLSPGPEDEVEWWPPVPRGGFRADPFGVRREGRLLMLYEELDYSSGRGRIVGEARREDQPRADRTGSQADGAEVKRGVAMGGTEHFSYPYLFEHEGDLYCVPEMADQRRVVLYRARDFPTSWEEVASLLEDVAALDSTLFRHDGRWWLFCTDRDAGPRHVLKAWYAPDLTGPWRPHAANPVKVDVHAARPGGTPFRHGGELYRPAQDGGRSYGEAVVINRVVELTPDRFAEEAVRRVTLPSDGPYPDGIHTLAAVGPELTLVDGNRRRFSAAEFRRRVGIPSGRGGG